MSKAVLFFVDGFEELEALAPIDILRRGGVEVDTVSLTGNLEITGSHFVKLQADKLFADINENDYDLFILPGGPGTEKYMEKTEFLDMLKRNSGKRLSAICAAPSVLGRIGLLAGKKAVCYPGYEKYLDGAEVLEDKVITDGNITTARGAGAAYHFAFELLSLLKGSEAAAKVRDGIIY